MIEFTDKRGQPKENKPNGIEDARAPAPKKIVHTFAIKATIEFEPDGKPKRLVFEHDVQGGASPEECLHLCSEGIQWLLAQMQRIQQQLVAQEMTAQQKRAGKRLVLPGNVRIQ